MFEKKSQIEKKKKKLAKLAVKIAKYYKINLDFTEKSIEQVEFILDSLHKEYMKTKKNDGYAGIAIEFAAYIITVIEKKYGKGKWQKDHPVIGENSYPFHWKNKDIFPFGWCMKRLMEGPGNNVLVKYNEFVVNYTVKTDVH